MASTDSFQDELTFVVCDPAPYPPPVVDDEGDSESKVSKKGQEQEEPDVLDLQEKPLVIIRYGYGFEHDNLQSALALNLSACHLVPFF